MRNLSEKQSFLEKLHFNNRFVNELPADPEIDNHRRQVERSCYSRVQPKSVQQPELVCCSREAAALIDLPENECFTERFAEIYSGNILLPGMDPYAMCYGGHQFGNWAGQLGDGRAINLGEVKNSQGQHWTLQLKGAGPTPYSRNADGLAVLRSSVREFLCSEAMFHLGVPTTRALSLVLTGEQVVRDMFYDGNPQAEPGAVVCRMAPSFLRFGNFEIFAARGDVDSLRKLLDFTIRTDFPHLGEPSREVYLQWYDEVCARTLEMIVHWQRVGFVHGVMNTDNMSILGLTIDYGPYGWLENYDPDWTPNTTDANGRRYRSANQPMVAQWNLAMLAQAIYHLVEDAEPLEQALNNYQQQFTVSWNTMMSAKLGLQAYNAASDNEIFSELLAILQLVETDMTIFFRCLADVELNEMQADDEKLIQPLQESFYQPDQLDQLYISRLANWLRNYLQRVASDGRDDTMRRSAMARVNPRYVLRNYLAQLAIDKAAEGDYSLVGELLDVLRRPYDEQPGKEEFARKRPEWARSRPGCSMLSCSS